MAIFSFCQWIIYWGIIKVLIKERSVKLREVIIVILMGCSLVIVYSYVGIFAAMLIYAYLYYMLYVEKKYSIKKAIILASMSMIILVLADHITSFFGNVFFANDFHKVHILLLYHLPVVLTLSMVSSYLIARNMNRVRSKITEDSHLQTAFMSACILILVSFYGSAVLGIYLGNTIELIQLNLFFFIIYVMISLIAIYFYVKSLKGKYEEQKKKDEYEALQKYMMEIEKQFTEMRRFKHDYQNILVSLDDYIIEKDYDKLRKYYFDKIKMVSERIMKNDFCLENLSRVKIREIKSIIAAKLMLAQELGIEVSFEVKEDIEQIALDSVVFVRIIGILLDNAIEELVEIKQGKLIVGIFQENLSTVFIVQNTCRLDTPKVYQLKQAGFSTKGKGRGLGLSNLSELTQNYKNVSNEIHIMQDQFIQKFTIGG